MVPRPPRSTLPDSLLPATTLVRTLGAERPAAVSHHALGRLGRQALPPVLRRQPVAEFEVARFAVAQADGTDRLVLALQGDREGVLAPLLARGLLADPGCGGAGGIRVGDARCHAGDLPAAHGAFDRRGVAGCARPQDEAAGLNSDRHRSTAIYALPAGGRSRTDDRRVGKKCVS